MEYTQKPKPLSTSSIGIFNFYLDLMTYMCIFTNRYYNIILYNSGLMTFTNQWLFPEADKVTLYCLFLFGFFAFKFIIDITLQEPNNKVYDIQ